MPNQFACDREGLLKIEQFNADLQNILEGINDSNLKKTIQQQAEDSLFKEPLVTLRSQDILRDFYRTISREFKQHHLRVTAFKTWYEQFLAEIKKHPPIPKAYSELIISKKDLASSSLFDHNKLIRCARLFHLTKVDDGGLCNGFTMRWIDACLTGNSQLFYARLHKMAELNDKIQKIFFPKHQSLKEFEKQNRWIFGDARKSIYATRREQVKDFINQLVDDDPKWKAVINDIQIFIDNLLLYQQPDKHKEVFGKYLGQHDVKEIAPLAQSWDAECLFGRIKETQPLRYGEFRKEQIQQLIHELGDEIIKSGHKDPIFFKIVLERPGAGHAVSLSFNPNTKKWLFMDVNQFPTPPLFLENLNDIEKMPFNDYKTYYITAIIPQKEHLLRKSLRQIKRFGELSEDLSEFILNRAPQRKDTHTLRKFIERKFINEQPLDAPLWQKVLDKALEHRFTGVAALLINLRKEHSFTTEQLIKLICDAAFKKNIAMIPLLLQHKTFTQLSPEQQTQLLYNTLLKLYIDDYRTYASQSLERAALFLLNRPESHALKLDQLTSLLKPAIELNHIEVVLLLLKNKELLNSLDSTNHLIHLAVECRHVAMARLLLEHGANPNIIDNAQYTPLSIAAERGHYALVKLLLDYNADSSIKNYFKLTPIESALEKGHNYIVELLLNQPNTLVENHLLNSATKSGDTRAVTLLLDHKDITPDPWPLVFAIAKGNEQMVQTLLSHPKINTLKGYIPTQEDLDLVVPALWFDKTKQHQVKNLSELPKSLFDFAQALGQQEIATLIQNHQKPAVIGNFFSPNSPKSTPHSDKPSQIKP